MEVGWDKLMGQRLREMNIPHETAMAVVGIIAEEKQIADRIGYKRGYNQGYNDGYVKAWSEGR